MKTYRTRGSGFTLIEIMIVVGIIGLLAYMAIASFMVARRNSRNVVFANDISKACNAFEMYCMEKGTYPPDKTPAVIPAGMQGYLPKMDWTAETPIGGYWDWDNGQFGHRAGVSVYKPKRTDSQMLVIDGMLDDGNLSTGSFRSRSQGYIYIIEF